MQKIESKVGSKTRVETYGRTDTTDCSTLLVKAVGDEWAVELVKDRMQY